MRYTLTEKASYCILGIVFIQTQNGRIVWVSYSVCGGGIKGDPP